MRGSEIVGGILAVYSEESTSKLLSDLSSVLR